MARHPKGLHPMTDRITTMPIPFFKKALAAIALIAGFAAAPVQAQITSITTTTSGTTDALNFTVRVSPEAQYQGQGKLYFVVLHNGQFYLLSETRGFVPYTGGEIPEYKTIYQQSETLTANAWNTRSQLGASVFVGYGTDFWEMLNSGRFRQVTTLAQYPTTPPTTPPVASNPFAAFNGGYRCYSETGAVYPVTATFTATQAVVDTSRILTIPDYTISVPFTKIDSNGDRAYNNNYFPLRLVSLDTAPGARYPLGLAYGASASSTPRIFVCVRA
jgi:hemin uptake protein HemP